MIVSVLKLLKSLVQSLSALSALSTQSPLSTQSATIDSFIFQFFLAVTDLTHFWLDLIEIMGNSFFSLTKVKVMIDIKFNIYDKLSDQ